MPPFVTIMASLISAAVAPQPIQLETVPRAGGVDVQVVGRSEVATAARYRLEVSSGSSGNRSAQSGTVRLTPRQPVILVRLHMSSGEEGDWSIRLFVEPEGAAPYELSAGQPEAPAA